ncbi:DUF4260 family protein [Aerophototrophica crusticola]|uniref:DUF4260 family protein n=1 Tax=Aerophototrophica crusticola TaxID=1709002 RepID=A0A858R5M0_9PROT|nr:DUF4260 family protein [Rhodospirillaceae bacterium B3]
MTLADGCPGAGAVKGAPLLLLRLEGAAALALSVLAYREMGGGWGWFLGLFLLPDLSMLGYMLGARAGAACYNLAHTYLAPALVGIAAWVAGAEMAVLGSLIWSAHVGFDRLLGYGLKYPDAFGSTHLGTIGRAARRAGPEL